VYDLVMKSIMLALFLSAGGAWAADEVADRAAIEKTIAALNVWPARPSLFTADFEDFDTLTRVVKASIPIHCPEIWPETCVSTIPVSVPSGPGHVEISKEPWGEATWTPPGSPWPLAGSRIKPTSIRFVTADVAIVDAMGKGPVLFVLRKEQGAWKIAAVRILPGRE
jgi:hypothetical protein